jgi:co-chaperonin GroES (HSP10)
VGNAATRADLGIINLGKIGEARLDLIPELAECKPGLRPTEYNVIVAPARTAEKAGSIFKPEDYRETEELAMQVGRIVAMSPLAFDYTNNWPDGTKPKVGDIIWYARYAGALIERAFDGQMYRMVKDKDIAAVIEPPETSA